MTQITPVQARRGAEPRRRSQAMARSAGKTCVAAARGGVLHHRVKDIRAGQNSQPPGQSKTDYLPVKTFLRFFLLQSAATEVCCSSAAIILPRWEEPR